MGDADFEGSVKVPTHKHPQWKMNLLLAGAVLIALVLCVQCVRTYLYTGAVLVPQRAEREAERQAGALTVAAHSAGLSDARAAWSRN
jgi:O-antigen ligase